MLFDWIKEYIPYISNIGTFLKIMKYAPEFLNKMREEWNDFEEDNDLNISEVYEKLEDGGIHIGSNIYTRGYILQYGQIFVPYTYTDSVFSPSNSEDVENFNKKHRGTIHELPKGEILFKKKGYYPCKKIESIQ